MHEVWSSVCTITVAIVSGFALYFEFDSIGLMMALPIKSWSKQESSAELKTRYEDYLGVEKILTPVLKAKGRRAIVILSIESVGQK